MSEDDLNLSVEFDRALNKEDADLIRETLKRALRTQPRLLERFENATMTADDEVKAIEELSRKGVDKQLGSRVMAAFHRALHDEDGVMTRGNELKAPRVGHIELDGAAAEILAEQPEDVSENPPPPAFSTVQPG